MFSPTGLKLAFPHIFLLTLGLLCAVTTFAETIRGTDFTCFMDSALLSMILRKGRDKRCHRTSALIKTIFMTLIHLSAQPSFVLTGKPPLRGIREIEIPTPIRNWLRHMRRSPAEAIASALITADIIPPL